MFLNALHVTIVVAIEFYMIIFSTVFRIKGCVNSPLDCLFTVKPVPLS